MDVDKVENIDSDLVNQTIAFDSKNFLYAITDEDRVLNAFPADFVVLRRPLKSPSIQVWDISRRQVCAEVDATTFHFKQMHLTSDGRELAVLDSDGNATCYKLPSGDQYEKLTEVHDICFSADGKYRALVRWGDKVIVETVLRLPPRKLLRDLTAEEWDFYIGSEVPYRMTREALLNRN